MPAILLVTLSQISFWINKEATPARVIFGSNSVLTLSMLALSNRKSMPAVSYITAIDVYLTVCFAFTFFTVVQYAFINSFILAAPKKLIADLNDRQKCDKIIRLNFKAFKQLQKQKTNSPMLVKQLASLRDFRSFDIYELMQNVHDPGKKTLERERFVSLMSILKKILVSS